MKIWFMFSNHTFANVAVTDKAAMVKRALELFDRDGSGSLFVRDEMDGSLNNLSLHGRVMPGGWGVAKKDLETWADAVLVEQTFRTLMA